MNETQAFIQGIRELIQQDKPEEALLQLGEFLQNNPLRDKALRLSAQLKHIHEQIHGGTVSHTEANITRNQIIEGITALLKEMEQGFSEVFPEEGIPRNLTPNPFKPERFLGREADLQAIRARLVSGDHLLLLVNGQGGVGKTSVASEYYRRYQTAYTHTAWVLSERSITDALLLLAKPLGVEFPDQMPAEKRLELLLVEMANLKKPCLIVIDNANEPDNLHANYQHLRRLTGFHLLLTTRITNFAQAETWRIEGLPEDEALQLFKLYYPKFDPEKEEALFRDIRAAVGGNTLVMELLAKNLALFNRLKTRYALNDLLADLQQKGLFGLSHSQEVGTDYQSKAGIMRMEKPEAIIAAMYDLGKLAEKETVLLSMFAVLPAEAIPFETLEKLLTEEEALEKSVLALAQKGWIEFNEVETTFKISPVVQQVVKRKNQSLALACRPLIRALNKELHWDVLHKDNYAHSTRFARYAEAVMATLSEPSDDLGMLCQNVGNFYTDTGALEKTWKAYEQMSRIFLALNETNPDDADFKNGLAISYCRLGETQRALGNVEFALRYFEQYTELEKVLYNSYPGNVEFKNNLAISYERLGSIDFRLGNWEQALIFYKKANKLVKELHKADLENESFKKGLAVSYERLGDIHLELNNLKQALFSFKQYNRLNKKLYKIDSQNESFKFGLAISNRKLGATYLVFNSLEQSLFYFEEFNNITKELYNTQPENVSFKSRFAISCFKLGELNRDYLEDLPKAQQYFQVAKELWTTLVNTSPQYIEFQRFLSQVKKDLAELE